jgi:hypothetical protein
MIGRIWAAMLKAASVALWAQIGAGMAFTVGTGALVWIIWQGPWSATVERARLDWLGWISAGSLGLVLVALVAIAGLRLGVKASKDGFDASVERDDPTVTTTTTTKVSP